MKRKPPIALVALFALTSACALETGADHQAIIDGTPTADADFPTVGAVLTSIGSLCTATLVHPQVMLTAGHCVEPTLLQQQSGSSEPIEYSATFARDIRAAGDGEILAVTEVAWHPTFPNLGGVLSAPGQFDDIALVALEEPITDRPVQTFLTTDDPAMLAPQSVMPVVGYGLTDDTDDTSAGVLHDGASTLDMVGDYELIAGTNDVQQACRGDSGGPALAVADSGDLIQVGVASRINAALFPPPDGPPPCEGGLVYTRVDSYGDWVNETIESFGFDPGEGGGDGDGDGDGDGEGDGDEGGCSTTGGGSCGWMIALVGVALLRRRRSVCRAG
jgi:uncharacterized protein (TIGR03382 family)